MVERFGKNFGIRRRTGEANWKKPLKWNKLELCPNGHGPYSVDAIGACPECDSKLRRPRVFCASLADWLDDEVPIEWLADLLDLIRVTPNLDWLLLTKRPENFKRRLQAVVDMIPRTGIDVGTAMLRARVELMLRGWHDITYSAPEIGIENYWIGTTVEDQQRADERIPYLLDIPAKVRFLSCEPLLGPVDFELTLDDQDIHPRHNPISWIIAGGESGPGFREFNPDWARSLRDQCAAAGVAFLAKQMGGLKPSMMPPIPDDLMIRQYP